MRQSEAAGASLFPCQ